MKEFNAGDRVTALGNNDYGDGTVVEQVDDDVFVRFDAFLGEIVERPALRLVKLHDWNEDFVSKLATDMDLAEAQARIKPNDVSSYYAFPGGAEVKDISVHLTSCGAQALQYIARSTRLDGKNKGERVKDLSKAIDFIMWEIERVENENV